MLHLVQGVIIPVERLTTRLEPSRPPEHAGALPGDKSQHESTIRREGHVLSV